MGNQIFHYELLEVSVIICRHIFVEPLINVSFYDLMVNLSLSLEHGGATLSNHGFFLFLFFGRFPMSMWI